MPVSETNVPIPVDTFPNPSKTGPAAAATAANLTIVFWVAGPNLFHLSVNFCMALIPFVTYGINWFPIGCSTSTCIVLQSPPRAPDNVSYFTFASSSTDSLLLSIASLAVDIEVMTCGPRSSHIVPNKLTPAVLCATGSSMEASPFITSLNASFAVSPPAPNFSAIFAASIPRASNPCFVVSEPSIALIENSFTASPTLSRLKAPF